MVWGIKKQVLDVIYYVHRAPHIHQETEVELVSKCYVVLFDSGCESAVAAGRQEGILPLGEG